MRRLSFMIRYALLCINFTLAALLISGGSIALLSTKQKISNERTISTTTLAIEGVPNAMQHLKRERSKSAPVFTPESVHNTTTQAQAGTAYHKLPLQFEANEGQTNAHVKFLGRGNGYNLFLTSTEVVLALSKPTSQEVSDQLQIAKKPATPRPTKPRQNAVVRMKLLNATPRTVEGQDELPGKVNYFIGNDPAKWRTDIISYRKVKYHGVYPGIDLIYYGNQRQLEYDFVVSPGADPRAITLSFTGVRRLRVDAQGDLVLATKGSELRQYKPLIYQEVSGGRKELAGHYVIKSKHKVGFEIKEYDRSLPLIIDPVLSYSTYLGGSGDDQAFGITVDSSGNAYVTGHTNSINFPTYNAYQQSLNNVIDDVFVTKLNAAGNALVYSTYLGADKRNEAYGVAVDSAGNAYITGSTESSNFPTANAYQASGTGVFVTKLNASGNNLIYSTYLGYGGEGQGIVVDSSGSAYVTGDAGFNFPTVNAYQSNGGPITAFATKLNPTGASLSYSTYLPEKYGRAIAIDSSRNAYITGISFNSKAFALKLGATGSTLVYTFQFGGSDTDSGNGIAVDSSGNAYVVGTTRSADFPTVNAYQPTFIGNQGSSKAFLSKINAAGSALIYSTYFGGVSGNDFGYGITIDSSGEAYITGIDQSVNFPVVNAYQSTCTSSNYCAYVTKFNAAGTDLIYSTYISGGGNSAGNYGQAIAVDSSGNAYVTGYTYSNTFPTVNAYQSTFGGGSDVFIAKLTEPPAQLPDLTISASVGGSYTAGQTGIQVPVTVTRTGGNLPSTGVYVEADLYWSTASTFDPNTATRLWQSNNSTPDFAVSALNSSGSITATSTFNIPTVTTGGTYYILAVVDPMDSYSESNKTNNVAAYPVTVSVTQSAPTITGITPATVIVNQPTTLTVSGSNFQNGFRASVTAPNGTIEIASALLTFISSSQVQVPVTMGNTPPYTATLKITNPENQSATKTFQVVSSSGSGETITYTYDSLNRLIGVTYASGASIAYSYDPAGNRLSIQVTGGSSPPVITSLNPSTAVAGSPGFQLTVTGSNFVNASTVQWNGENRPTTFISSTQLTATIPATDIAAAGTPSVTVVNPANLTSNAIAFTISNPIPTCTIACAATVPSGGTTGTPVAFTASATPSGCTGSPAYDWDFGDGAAHSSQQNPTHSYATAGTYTWKMTASISGTTSCMKTGTITVAQACTPPVITTQPGSQTISGGQMASLSVVAGGTAPLTYQWYQGLSGDTSTPIGGATASSYTTQPLTASTNFWVRITNLCGTIDSSTASVTVTPVSTSSAVQFSAASYSAGEGDGTATITVTRSGDTSGISTVNYATSDGTASQRTKYITSTGTLTFAPGEVTKTFSVILIDEAFVEGTETVNLTLSSPVGATLGTPLTATLMITDNDSVPGPNPIDAAQYFVQQHYYDFLGRVPDQGGLNYWTNQITLCGTNQACIIGRRIGVSAAYFTSQEFQDTGNFVYLFYKASYGQRPTYAQFVLDRSRVIGGANLDSSKLAFADAWVQRADFLAKYPASLDGPHFIDALLQTVSQGSGVDLSGQRQALIADYTANGSRARIVRQLVDNASLKAAEYNPAFVLMQYFGYLRRDPDEEGYKFWLRVMNGLDASAFKGMTCAFITSREYQERFSSVVNYSNSDCARAAP